MQLEDDLRKVTELKFLAGPLQEQYAFDQNQIAFDTLANLFNTNALSVRHMIVDLLRANGDMR